MLKLLPVLALAATCLSMPTFAAEASSRADLMLGCGAGYLLIAGDPLIAKTEEEKLTFTNLGNVLSAMGDKALADSGMAAANRAARGFRIRSELEAAMESGTNPAFDPDDCLPLLEGEETKAASVDEDERDARIDMLMTCGAGFIVSAQSLQEQGDDADAAMLEQLGTSHIAAAEDLMIESGLGKDARFQISKMYGEQVGTKMRAGEQLDYDWDACATLEY